MRSTKGFTLIELMVVVLIVAVLAAILVPLLTARLEAARWAEGKAAMGTIATCIRAYHAEHQDDAASFPTTYPSAMSTYMLPTDLQGKYFQPGWYTITSVPAVSAGGVLSYTITCTTANASKFSIVTVRTLNEAGVFNPP